MSVHFLPLCRDGIDAVRGCVEEMKGQMPVDGATGSSRVVRRGEGRKRGHSQVNFHHPIEESCSVAPTPPSMAAICKE